MPESTFTHTPQQREAIESVGKHLCVDAGAGTGKTHVLVDRIIRLIETRQADLDEIVAITFTDKAAAEMKKRLRDAARKKAPLDDPERMTFWRDVERRVDTARISTIHAFCSRLLRENALRTGLDPDFSMLSEPETHLLRERAVRDALHSLLEERDEHATRLAVHYGLWSLQGTILGLLQRRATVSRIVSTSPDSPDALLDEWKRSLDGYNNARLDQLRSSQKPAGFCDRLREFDGECSKSEDKREQIRLLAIATCESIANAPDTHTIERALRTFVDSWNAYGASARNWPSAERYNQLKVVEEEFKAFCLEHMPLATDPAVDEQAARLTADFIIVLRFVNARYQEAKRGRTVLDFDDLLLEAHLLLHSNKRLRSETASSIKHLLIDEFQDTDHMQLDIAWLLARTNNRRGAELFIVGDPKQSIYRFRGAEVEVFAESRNRVETRKSIDKNFRSVPEILGFVNAFCDTSGLYEFNGTPYAPLRAHRTSSQQCRVEFLCPQLEEKMNAVEGRELEAGLIACRLAAVCGADPVRVLDRETNVERDATFGDAVILLRTMSDLYVYESALKKHGIPYNVVQGAGFYERQEVHDLVNLLKAALEPWNGLALCGFLRSPLVALTDEALFELGGDGMLAHAFNAGRVLSNPEMNRRLDHARELVQSIRRRQHLPIASLLRAVLAESGFEAMLLAQPHGTRKLANVQKVVDIARNLTDAGTTDLHAFVHYVDQMAASAFREGDAPLPETESGVVTIMTVHQSKGLEFPVVVVADIAKGRQGQQNQELLFVHRALGMASKIVGDDGKSQRPALADAIQRAEKQEELDEHARILYVAMTRARDWLLIAGAQHQKPAADSWLEWLDAQFEIRGRRDGEIIDGGDWRAVVRRQLPHVRVKRGTAARAKGPDLSAMRRIAAPISKPRAKRLDLPVSRVIELAGSEFGAEVRRTKGISPLRRGTIVHRLFESWAFEDGYDPPIDEVLRHEPLPASIHEELRTDLQRIAERFSQSRLFATLCAERPLERELQFTLALGEDFVAGAIDILSGAGTIVDFKTGAYREKATARYTEQVQIYAAALESITNDPIRTALLYYVDDGMTKEVDVSPDAIAAALEIARRHIQTLHAS